MQIVLQNRVKFHPRLELHGDVFELHEVQAQIGDVFHKGKTKMSFPIDWSIYNSILEKFPCIKVSEPVKLLYHEYLEKLEDVSKVHTVIDFIGKTKRCIVQCSENADVRSKIEDMLTPGSLVFAPDYMRESWCYSTTSYNSLFDKGSIIFRENRDYIIFDGAERFFDRQNQVVEPCKYLTDRSKNVVFLIRGYYNTCQLYAILQMVDKSAMLPWHRFEAKWGNKDIASLEWEYFLFNKFYYYIGDTSDITIYVPVPKIVRDGMPKNAWETTLNLNANMPKVRYIIDLVDDLLRAAKTGIIIVSKDAHTVRFLRSIFEGRLVFTGVEQLKLDTKFVDENTPYSDIIIDRFLQGEFPLLIIQDGIYNFDKGMTQIGYDTWTSGINLELKTYKEGVN